ncbi:regulatory signaling modulator protein AmpE [Sulfuriflexus mobilis]|uniref:regulatory signaling modulator protein AmpE n=1 Tax=Sulfuriflexus mobilis TaxID=1811807 RepID=UPI000F83360A|nr:regulatory signaling modulator protein AmpE [Sulfuriflexus mobilis]
MTLLAILISLILEHSVEGLRAYRRFDWFERYTDKLMAWLADYRLGGPLQVLLVMLVPVLAVILINMILHDVLLGLLSLAFSILVLFICLGPKDLDGQIDSFLEAWKQGDEAAARQAAEDLLESTPPEALPDLQQALLEKILLAGHDRLLAPIFWFTVFSVLGAGPLGVVMYRLAYQLHHRFADTDSAFAEAAKRLHDILAWLPAHMTALAFAMAGSFVDAFHAWRERRPAWRDDWQASVEATVLAGGLGALQMHEGVGDTEVSTDDVQEAVSSAKGIVLRALVVSVVLIALMTLFGGLR